MKSFSILIPAYNEEAALEDVVKKSLLVLEWLSSEYEVVILDDASTDKTPEIISKLRGSYPKQIRSVRHKGRQGMAKTFEELYRLGTKEYVFLVHGDGEYPPELLKRIIPKLETCDIVSLRRMEKNYNTYRQVLSFGYRWIPCVLFGVDLYDSGCSKCILRKIIEETPIVSKGIFAEAERVIRAVKKGYRFGAIEVYPELRRGGKATGGNFFHAWQVLSDIVRLWFSLNISKEKKLK